MKPSQVPFIINFGLAAPLISQQARKHGWKLTRDQGKRLNDINHSLDWLYIEGMIGIAARRAGRIKLCNEIPRLHKKNKEAQ